MQRINRGIGALATGLVLAVAGCGRGGSADLPSACHFAGGARTVRDALTRAPGAVTVDGTPLSKCLGREADSADVQAAGARTNAELGELEPEIAERVAVAGDEVAEGGHDDQFPIDVFQTGSGTSSNMNANEVIANLAGEGVHPNDHVNRGQSSNDVFPSAVHLAALGEANVSLLPALEKLSRSLRAKADAFQ